MRVRLSCGLTLHPVKPPAPATVVRHVCTSQPLRLVHGVLLLLGVGLGRLRLRGVRRRGRRLQRPEERLNAEARGVEAHLCDDAPGAAIIERLTECLSSLRHATARTAE